MQSNARWATTSQDLQSSRSRVGKLRSWLRHLVLESMYPALLCREMFAPLTRPHLRIVYYHFVFDDERATFDQHLSFFKDHYEVLPLGEALDRLQNGSLRQPSLSITFDDGYQNNITNAAELLSKHRLPACFYITSDFVSLDTQERQTVQEFCQRNLQLPVPVPNMDWEEVRRLRLEGHEIGSHTLSHQVLTDCNVTDPQREIVQSKATIEEHLGEPVHHFSVPFGFRSCYSTNISKMVRDAGYRSSVLGIRGANLPRCDLFQLRRDGVEARWSVKEVRTHLLRTSGRTQTLFPESFDGKPSESVDSERDSSRGCPGDLYI